MCTVPAPMWYSEVVLHRRFGAPATCCLGQEPSQLQVFSGKRMKGFETVHRPAADGSTEPFLACQRGSRFQRSPLQTARDRGRLTLN